MLDGTIENQFGRLFWVYTGDLRTDLDAATWLQATRHLRRQGWQVTLVAACDGADAEGVRTIRGVEVLLLRRPRLWMLGQMLFHARVLGLIQRQQRELDAVLFHEMSALWLLPLRLLGAERPRLVMDSRTLFMANAETAGLKDRLRKVYFQLMQRVGNHLADGRLCITPGMAEACRVPRQRLWGIWPSGVDPESFAVPPDVRRWPVGDKPIQLVYIGALHAERNLLGLCRAVVAVNGRQRRFELTLIGDGSERPALERLAAACDGMLHVFRPIAHSAIPRILRHAHVGTLPFPDEQKFRVSSPIKLFEYMASGLPILATRIRCHTDVVGDDGYVFWAEGADEAAIDAALERIWAQRERLAELGQAAAASARAWSWEVSARRLGDALATHLQPRADTGGRAERRIALSRHGGV